jgi:hypothetical protein
MQQAEDVTDLMGEHALPIELAGRATGAELKVRQIDVDVRLGYLNLLSESLKLDVRRGAAACREATRRPAAVDEFDGISTVAWSGWRSTAAGVVPSHRSA